MTYRIPVMENPNRWPGGGQLFGEFKHEPCAPSVDLLEERSIIPLWGVPSGASKEQCSQQTPQVSGWRAPLLPSSNFFEAYSPGLRPDPSPLASLHQENPVLSQPPREGRTFFLSLPLPVSLSSFGPEFFGSFDR